MKTTRYTIKRKTSKKTIADYREKANVCLDVYDLFIQRENDEIDNAIYTLQRMVNNYQK